MSYSRRLPNPPLSLAIDHLWAFDGYEAPRLVGHLFADSCADLMFDLGEPFAIARLGVTTRLHGAFVSGQRQAPIDVLLRTPRFTLVGARLRPGGLPALLGAPAHETVDATVELHEFWSRDAEQLTEQMAATLDSERRLDLLESWLEMRFEVARLLPVALTRGIEALSRDHTRGAVGRAADKLGIGSRQLDRIFRSQIGITPKSYQRIARFRALQRQLTLEPGEPGWAALAQRFGYSDQAHMCREFRAFTGVSPTGYSPWANQAPPYMPWAPI